MKLNVVEELSAKGFRGARELFQAFPRLGVSELAERLDGIAPIVVLHEYLHECEDIGEFRDAAMDLFVREFKVVFPNGFSNGANNESLLIMLANWSSDLWAIDLGPKYEKDIDAVIDEIRSMEFPEVWRPESPNDRILEEAFRNGWPCRKPEQGEDTNPPPLRS
jgi:hypothetical protein